ncbi:MAG: hypothetical protein AB1491_02995 [Thermodesulfobacteriota bacterium]
MIYTTKSGESFDTETDLAAPERHLLQKLFIWKEMAASVEEFRQKRQEALRQGWGDSVPIPESPALKSITRDLEEQVAIRVLAQKEDQG